MMTELKRVLRHRGLTLTMLAVLLIPFVYSFCFLTSAWDPYGNTGKIPVAVVNLDKPSELKGQTIQAGADTIKELHDNKQLEWHFVSQKDAEEGLKNNKYYTVVTIPENFSANAATVLDEHPKKMKLSYETNGSLNYVSEIISQVGADTLLSQIKSKVTNAFVTTLFDQVNGMAPQLKTAAEGSATLRDGVAKYTDGVSQVDGGLSQLYAKVPTLSDGVHKLTDGGQQLEAGLGTLANGTQQLKQQGTTALANGLTTMKTKTQALPGGVQQLLDGLEQLEYLTLEERNGNPSMPDGVTQLHQGVQRLKSAIGQQKSLIGAAFIKVDMGVNPSTFGVADEDLPILGLKPGEKAYPLFHYEKADQNASKQADKDMAVLEAAVAANPTPETQAALAQFKHSYATERSAKAAEYANAKNNLAYVKESITSMKTQANGDPKGLYNALTILEDKLTTLDNELSGGKSVVGHDTYKSAVTQLIAGMKKLNGATPTLMAGLDQLVAGAKTLDGKMGEVVSGSSQLATGSSTLANGLKQLNGNVPALSSGVTQLHNGAQQLTANNQQLKDGTTKLATGLDDGYKQIASQKLTKMTAQMFAEPAVSEHNFFSSVKNYGAALAPFVLALALFIAIVIFNFAYPMKREAGDERTVAQWLGGKILMGTLVAVGMALIEATMMRMMGLQVEHLLGFYGITVLFALAAMYMTQALNIAFGGLGIFIALGLLTLSGSGGLFPAETVSPLYESTQKFLPMTYAINGYRQMISSGIATSTVTTSIVILISVAALSLAAMVPAALWRAKPMVDAEAQV